MICRCASRRWPHPPAPLPPPSSRDCMRRAAAGAARPTTTRSLPLLDRRCANGEYPPSRSFGTSSSRWSTSSSSSSPSTAAAARPRAGGMMRGRGSDEDATTMISASSTKGVSRIYNGGGHRDRRVVVAKDDDAGENGPGRRNRSRSRSIRHSTRLIGEIAARRTTDLLLKAHDESIRRLRDRRRDDDGGRRATVTTTQDDDGVVVRWDAAALLAAEQALEFWAHRAEYRDDRRDRRGGRDGWDRRRGDGVSQRDGRYSSTIEDDAGTALRLFAALHHFHLLANDANDDDDDDDEDDGKNEVAVLTNGMYSHVVDALAKSPNVEHVASADALLRQFVSLCVGRRRRGGGAGGPAVENEMPRHRSPRPSDRSIDAAPFSFEDPGGLRWNDGDRHHLPNHVRITGVMRGYARHARPRDAERLLDLMVSLSSYSPSSGVVGDPRDRDLRDRATMFRPNDVGYATVIDAYSRAQDGPNAERVLGMMKRRGGGRDDDGRGNGNRANVVAYNAAISAWARSARERRAPPPPAVGRGDDRRAPPSSRSFAAAPTQAEIASSRRAAEGAERLLREMWSEHDRSLGAKVRRGGAILLPDVVSYSAVISAYAACLDQPYGIGRARELLAELEGLAARQEVDESTTGGGEGRSNPSRRFGGSDDGGVGGGGGRHPHGFCPNALTYNALLQAYANAGDASSAEGVLLSMISWHASSLREEGGGGRFMHVRPNTRTFNVVLNALARVEGGDGGVRASELLGRLVELGSSHDDGPRPDVISYNTVLAAWSKSAGVRPGESPSAGEGGTQKRKGVVGEFAANEALKLLDEIEGRYLQSVESKTHGRSVAVKPDVISYNTTIAAFANAAQHCEDGRSMARKAEEILSRMFESGIEPDAYSYNGVLLAWARSSGGLPAARHAETILRSMKEPTIVSWSTVVTAYARADGAHRAEALLREMEENAAGSSWRSKGHRTPITPSVVLYNNVLHSWGLSSDDDASTNAELLLNRMEAASLTPAPDAISYRLVLNALEHSKDHDKAERAKSVLDRFLAFEMRKSLFKPHEIQNAYNSVLAACTYTPAEAGEHHRNNAARILLETLRDMNKFPWPADDGSSVSGPNQETYAHFVQGCVHLYGPVSEERNELLKSAFSECCQKGFLNRVIWDKFCVAMGPEAVQELLLRGEYPREK